MHDLTAYLCDDQMKTTQHRRSCGLALGGAPPLTAQGTVAPADAAQAARRIVADVQRRLLGPPLQPALDDRPSNVSALTLAWVYRPNPGNAPAGGGGSDGGHDQGHAGRRQRRDVRHDSRSRLGRGRAQRTRDLARDVAVEGRLAHRQSRRRRARAARCTSKRRTATSWRSTSATAARSGAPKSATSSSSTTPPPLRSSSATTSSSASAATTSTFPATSQAHDPETGARAVALVGLSRAGHAGSQDVAERRSDDARRRDDLGLDAPTIPSSI